MQENEELEVPGAAEEVESESPEVVEKPESEETEQAKPEPTPEEIEARKQQKLQKRFDRLTREKHEARAEADYLRSLLEGNKPVAKDEPASLDRENFNSDLEWIEAIADYKAEQKLKAVSESQAREQRQKQEQEKALTVAQKADKIFAEAAELGDYDEDDFNEIPFTQSMSEAILDSDISPKIVHYLAANPDQAQKISAMSPTRQAAEIGKLELKLSSPEPAKKSAAPEPIKPVSGAGKSYKGLSDEMSADEWLRERNRQLRER